MPWVSLTHERNCYGACMSATWDGARLAAAIAALKDAGMSESAIGRMAGASRASANRWARGTHRPDHDPIQRLAARVYARFPDLAHELVESSGYAWADPVLPPEPPPIPADVLAVMSRYPPEQQQKIIDELRKAREQAELSAEGQSPPGGGGTRRAG